MATPSSPARRAVARRPADRDVAMVFQNHALCSHLNVLENIAFSLRVRGIPSTSANGRPALRPSRLGWATSPGARPAWPFQSDTATKHAAHEHAGFPHLTGPARPGP